MDRLPRSLIYTIIAAVLLLPLPVVGALDGELRLQNDAFAWTTAGEWDDFRTAGGSLLLREGALAFRLGYYSLTRRSPDGTEPGLRSDELLLSGGRRYSLSSPGEEEGLFLTPGASFRLLGDFGSRAAQHLVHSQIKTERPIPESYSPAAWEAGADLRLAARFRLIPDRKFWWHAEANTELRSSGSASLSAEAGTSLDRADFFLKAAAAWQLEFGEVSTPALQVVRSQSAWPRLNLLYGTPPLLISRTAYLASGWGEGRIELSLPLNRRRESISATAPPLRNLTEIGMPLDTRALEQRSLLYPVRLPLSARLRLLAGGGHRLECRLHHRARGAGYRAQ